MKALMIAMLTAGALSVGAMSSNAATPQVHVGVQLGDGYNNGYNGGHRWHHRMHQQHCHMVKKWRHHHRVWVKQCTGW